MSHRQIDDRGGAEGMHRLHYLINGSPLRYRCSSLVRCSISRRMSFIGSTLRTRGTTSKLFSGGGLGVNHSSVFAFHGSGPAIGPRLSAWTIPTTVTNTLRAIMNAPTVEMKLYAVQSCSEYS